MLTGGTPWSGLGSIPVNWQYSIPYGLLYSLNAPEDVLRFVKAVEHITGQSHEDRT